jgi:predicted Fe-Mo cluster-binding NifX family protein
VGIRSLYHLQQDEPEMLYHSKLAAKAVGRTAAKMMAQCDVDEVYADVISDYAYDTLKDAGIRVRYNDKVNHARFLKIWEQMGEEKN